MSTVETDLQAGANHGFEVIKFIINSIKKKLVNLIWTSVIE